MLSLHTNAASLNTMNSMGSTNKTLSSSMTKLGTGYRVNSAMDDAAGLQIATRLNAQSRGMSVAQKNTQNGISMLQTAEGSMSEINNMLLRMKDLATEAANGTANQDDRDALQAEYGALGKEISNILKNTSFAGSTLFSDDGAIGNAGALTAKGALGKSSGVTFQVGASAAETIDFAPGSGSLKELFEALGSVSINIGDNASSTAFSIGGTDASGTAIDGSSMDDQIALLNTQWDDTMIDPATYTNEAGFRAAQATAREEIKEFLDTTPGAVLLDARGNGAEIASGDNKIITKLDEAINAVGTFRSDMGAVANRLEHTYNNLSNMITNTEAAKGRILDVDYAKESATMTKNQMLMQVSTSMLKQSNSLSQMVGSLVQ